MKIGPGWIDTPKKVRRKEGAWPTKSERPLGSININRLPRSEYTPHAAPEDDDACHQTALQGREQK
jgi:hypothetical protein